ncbi:MAG: alpha/beta fold hydrolase [Candidatus Aminicenantes bacterium]|nr:MAG: alpha/beta fold hydrolase [Candidatus Aminicenantes bacterium]
MTKKIIIMMFIFFLVFTFLFPCELGKNAQPDKKKKLFLYFMEEEVGYEEYEWSELPDKYVLSVTGELRNPISLVTELMTIEVDKEFRPLRFYFKGTVQGTVQEIETTITQGEAKNKIMAGERKIEMSSKISPDALILPNSIFSPYFLVARRIKGIKEKITIPAYVVPQTEVKLQAEPDKDNAQLFHLLLAGIKIELLTDERGFVKSISNPAQKFEAHDERLKIEKPAKKEEGIKHELVIQGSKLGKGFYNLQKTDEEILIKGETKQAFGGLSLSFQFEERLSTDWNLKEGFLKGEVNEEEVELRAKVAGDKINVSFRQGEKISEKQLPFTPDVFFSTENPLVDNFVLIKKISDEKKRKFYALSKSWGSYYLDEPLLVPTVIENEGEEILNWQRGDLKTEKFFMDYAGFNGGYIWTKEGEVLKISYPFQATNIYHQDYPNLETKKISSPKITSDKYISEDVFYPSGEIKLAGTVTIPKDGQSKHSAAILISGSGPQDRNEDTVGPGGLKFGIFKQIAHVLSENGIAVLRYDDRGTGRSQGNFLEASHKELIQDVQAGIAYLRSRDDVFEDRIALIGHSDGGIVAPQVASEDPKIRAIILLAGTGETGDKVLRQQFDFLLEGMEVPEENREKFQANYEIMLKIVKGEPVDKEMKEKIRPQLEPQIKWLQSFVNYDPLSALSKVEASVLVVNGGKDKQVFPHHARMLHHKLIELGKPATLKMFPDLNHLLIPSDTGAYSEYARQAMEEKRISQRLLNYMLGWLHGVMMSD